MAWGRHIFFVLLYFLCSVYAHNGRCLLFFGECVDYCPRGMHPYHTRCDVDTLSQRTCENPEILILGYTCGWSRCDCDNNLYLADDRGCVKLEDCPEPRSHRRERRRKHNKYRRKSVRVKDRDDEHLRQIDEVQT